VRTLPSVRPRRPWSPLTKRDLYSVHATSLEILERIGVTGFGEDAIKIFDDAGANVDHGSKRVTIPQYIVAEALKKAPSTVRLNGRSRRHNIRLASEDRRVNFTVGAEAPMVIDLDTDQQRPATKRDAAELARLVDALDYSTNIPLVTPQDVPPPLWVQHATEAVLNNTEKHVNFVCPTSRNGAKDVIRMAAAVVGSIEELRKKPVLSGGCQFTSPLQIPQEVSNVLVEFASNRIPLSIGSLPLAGATSPITLAGTLAQENAEILAGITLAQLVSPGTPVMYNGVGTIMDMQTANLSMGSPEQALLSAAVAQLSEHYRIPCVINCCLSESKVYDVQVGYEKATSAVLSALAGGDLLMGAGMLQYCEVSCYKALVIDNEIIGYALRIANGINVADETLALDLIEQVGPGGSFLTQEHTRDHFKEEMFLPRLTDRHRRAVWEKRGGKTMEKRAKERRVE